MVARIDVNRSGPRRLPARQRPWRGTWLAAAVLAMSCQLGGEELKKAAPPPQRQSPATATKPAAVPPAPAAQNLPPVEISNPYDARKAIGKRVLIQGIAQNAKISAVVVHERLTVYCLDRNTWPADVKGKPVSVQGTLESTNEFQTQPSPKGESSQGTSGAVLVLRKSEQISP